MIKKEKSIDYDRENLEAVNKNKNCEEADIFSLSDGVIYQLLVKKKQTNVYKDIKTLQIFKNPLVTFYYYIHANR